MRPRQPDQKATLSTLRAYQVALLGLTLVLLSGCVPPFSQVDPPELETNVTGAVVDAQQLRSFVDAGVRYVESGEPDAPLVFFLHGTPGSWHAFQHLLRHPALKEKRHLVAVDRPGFGGSSSLPLAKSFAEQTQLLDAGLARNRSGRRAVVVGHSLGGSIAYRFALDRPGEVGGLVIISSSISPVLGKPRWFNRLAALPGVSLIVPDGMMRANDEIMPLANELALMEPRLGTIRMPVTVLHGEDDNLVAVGNVDYVSEKLTGAVLNLVRRSETGHFLIWEQPELVVDAILAIEPRAL